MANKNFPTDFPQKAVPTSSDKVLISDTASSDAMKYANLGDLPVPSSVTTSLALKEDKANKGVANGYAPLDGSGKVPAANLPSGGSWDVVWPASSTDSHVVFFDGTSGKLIKDSGLTLSGTNTGDQTATTVPNTPAGNISATTVQGAINELDSEKVGKVSSTDNAVTRFNGTSGDVQNSSVTLDDNGNFASVNEIHFSNSPTASAYAEGTLRWNNTDHCLDIETGANTTLQVGQEMFVRVRNATGATITNGSLCYINGATGNRPTIALAKADVESTAHTLIGMATEDILNNSDGFITINGTVHDLNTSSFTDGAELFLSATTAGAFTNTVPSSPNFVVKIGVVSRSHLTQGQILVQPQVRTVSVSNIRGTLPVANGGTGLSALGTALQQLRVNAGGTALEYFTPSAGGSSLWTSVTGTRTSNTTFTVTGDQTATFARGLVIKWTESSIQKCGYVVSSSFSSVTTVTIIGDAMASIDSSSLKWTAISANELRFAVAGSIWAVATNVANIQRAEEPLRVLGANLWVWTAGTTNSTTVDVNKAGTTMFTTKPTLASTVAYSSSPFSADSGTSLAVGDAVTIDVDAVQSTPAVDAYVTVITFPTRILNLS